MLYLCLLGLKFAYVTGMQVWSVRVTVNILNYDGNLLDASSIATVGALMHFRYSLVGHF
jgi:exosome complex RNA-binding protein Rrp42 (RNase PH superfamily)